MDYVFHLNDVECEEPIGWTDFELSMKRDDTYHGMQFLASTGSLRFWGTGANYLRTQKDQNGIGAEVTFKAEATCDETYEEVISGRLNFGKYKDSCGNICIVEIPFEEDSCTVTLNSRFDNKVDLDSIIASDATTVLDEYTELGKTMPIPAKALQTAVDGSVQDDGFVFNFSTTGLIGVSFGSVYMRPDYAIERYNNIATGQLTAINSCVTNNTAIVPTVCDGPLTPQLLFEDSITCFDGNFTYTSRMKGVLNITNGNGVFIFKHTIFQWDGNGDIFTDGTIITENILFDYTAQLPNDLPDPPFSFPFDDTITGTTTIPNGEGFYAVLGFRVVDFDSDVEIDFDKDTLFRIEALKLCPSSNVQYYMVHEALSRVVENVTNGCIRVQSEYYGRTDSQPFSFSQDGCGSLRMITSGLKLRNAPNGQIFISPKDLISGLNAIDNIGFGMVDDPSIPAGRSIMQVEPIDFFYKDAQVLHLEAIPTVSNEIQENLHYARILVGYKKWEVEQVNGLNEFNSNREYRTNVETISTSLDIQSILIAGNYAIELTRQQTFAASGAADTTYDNETFIMCLTRGGSPFLVELNKILNPQNIFDIATIKNYRITPLRNLMRWFKSIINTYTNIINSGSRLFFSAGTANFLASGTLDDNTVCRLENGLTNIDENGNLGIGNFADIAQATPLLKNEFASFDYPLSLEDWHQLKANPYGYISYTCGTSATIEKGFVKEIKYRPAKGTANFTLRKKWGQ